MSSQVPDDSEDGRRTIDLNDETDRWRYTCPNGHRQWEPTNHHFWCASCARQRGQEATFHALHDRKTDQELERIEVRLVDGIGPYDGDLDRKVVADD
ncbi:hypothetical protein Hrd1104_00225 [Halorhabdus sp. CBA1104]|uniref:hypothetical protein n=1 Tax=Halorhabdus sp. CBA1104 TaxID=1380432 RepID=UPI0012B2839F|nr:hypothetical protein [Halorhabdus sp. CBA1104]QGN05869.1 hypothetical protein Hrd1104_00225 [Halorhabdus sp. CBA1104]